MKKETLAEAHKSFDLLLKQRQYAEAIHLLEIVGPRSFDNAEDAKMLLELLQCIPEDYLCKNTNAAFLYARLLRITGAFAQVVDWGSRVVMCQGLVGSAPVQVEAAAALNALKRYAEAQALLRSAILHLSGEILGIAWARLGFALFNLGEPIELWREAYASARPLLTGEELGRTLVNAGYCFSQAGLHDEAQGVYREALIYFRNNPYFQALTRYNLGIIALERLEPETEIHFLEAVRLTHYAKAAGLRSVAFIGLGTYRRALGEWSRAETAHREALQMTSNTLERERAYLGLARTQRLAGHPVESLESLGLALQEPGLELQLIYLAQALAFLALGQVEHARETLEKTGTVTSEIYYWLWRVARAELARQENYPDQAVALLEGLPLHTLHAREEVRQWPKLFELVQQAGREIPLPLEYPTQTTVEVKALGLLEVKINGRKVELHPLNRTGELLVFLLENGGEASSEHLVDALWEGASLKEKRKNLSDLVSELRHVLGWRESVRALRKAYQLDPDTCWVYDVDQARANKTVKGNFLEGIYSNWAREVDEELGAYREER